MTKLIGNINYIGPSGGVISPGDYNITTYPQTGGGNISVSGTNLLIYMSGPNSSDGAITIYNKGNFVVGDGGKIGEETPKLFSINARQTMQVKTKDTISFNVLNDTLDVIQQLSIGTTQIQLQAYNAARPSVNNSGIALLDSNNILPYYHVSGVLSSNEANITASDNIYINGQNIHLNTLEGRRPTINGSGIKVSGDTKYIMATAAAGQSVSSILSPLTWNSSVKYGITHADGNSKFYLTSPGVYLIDVVLSTDYNIGGHKIDLDLHHYDGLGDNIVVAYDVATSTRNRNYARVCYIVDTGSDSDHYIEIFCATTISQSGKVWRQDSIMTITKLN